MKKKSYIVLLLIFVCCIATSVLLASCSTTGDGGNTINPDSGNISPEGEGESTGHQHVWSEWRLVTMPTNATPGSLTRACECGETETFELPIIVDGAYTVEVVSAPTCTTKGKSKLSVKSDKVDFSFEIETPMVEHEYTGEYGYDNDNHWKICQNCDTKDKENHTFDPTTHKCICGMADPYFATEGLEFRLNNWGDGYVVSGYTGSDKDIYVPSYHNDMPVKSIGNIVFEDMDITSIAIPNTVTSIGSGSFMGCNALTSITLPDSMEVIDTCAFHNCANLTKVNVSSLKEWMDILFLDSGANPLENNAELYANGELITDVVIPDGVERIYNYAFSNYKKLASVTIPDTVVSIGKLVFLGCTNLKELVIPSSVTKLTSRIAEDCTQLEKITINSLVECDDYAFADLSALKEVKFGEGVKVLGGYMFQNATALESVTFPEGLETIGSNAFIGCSALTSVDMPLSLKTVGDSAFYNCKALKKVNVKSLNEWCGIDFASGLANPLFYAKDLYLNGYLIKNLDIPFGLTEVKAYTFIHANIDTLNMPLTLRTMGASAFEGCQNLTEIFHVSNSLTAMPDKAFYNCKALESVAIPYSVERIGNEAFAFCDSLNSVTLEEDLKEIGEGAFYFCKSLTRIDIPNTVTNIGRSAFLRTALTHITTPVVMENMTNYFSNSPDSNVAPPIDEIIITGGTAIPDNAFENFDVKKVVLPDSVTSIGYLAFSDAEYLESINLPSNIKSIGISAFMNCTKIASFAIPDGVETIGQGAFEGCEMLTNISLPSSVSELGVFIVARCPHLDTITIDALNATYRVENNCIINKVTNAVIGGCKTSVIPDGVTSIAEQAFYRTPGLTNVVIPDSVTSIGGNAFFECPDLVSVTMSDNVTEMTGYAIFGNCPKLESVRLSNGLATMPTGLFGDCVSLKTVNLPSNITMLKANTFVGCNALETVDIPAGVTRIHTNAFLRCANLNKIVIPINVEYMYEYICGNCPKVNFFVEAIKSGDHWGTRWEGERPVTYCYNNITSDATYDYVVHGNNAYLTRYKGQGAYIYVPETLGGNTVVDVRNVFTNKEEITNVVLPSGLTRIAEDAFAYCFNLQEINIPDKVESIGTEAFRSTSITTLDLPQGLKEMDDRVFWYCSKLRGIILPKTLTYVGSSIFQEAHNVVVYREGSSSEWDRSWSNGTYGKFYWYSETPPEQGMNCWHYASDGVTPVIWK